MNFYYSINVVFFLESLPKKRSVSTCTSNSGLGRKTPKIQTNKQNYSDVLATRNNHSVYAVLHSAT